MQEEHEFTGRPLLGVAVHLCTSSESLCQYQS
jgi:hypothetical protein